MSMTKIVTTGFPKSGTHMLAKACQLLGQPSVASHYRYTDEIPAGKRVFIKRDPRNIVCSWLRFNNKPVSPGMFITAFRKFQDKALVEEMGECVGWLTDPNTLVTSFESLISDESELMRIAEHLGVPYIPGAWALLPGLTMTYYAEHSDYATIWTPEVEDVWAAEGGPELLAEWGY